MSQSSKSKRERRRLNKALHAPLRVVVCHYPSTSLGSVAELLKAAVLYGDVVMLHSPIASMLDSIEQYSNAAPADFMDATLHLLHNVDLPGAEELRAKINSLDTQLASKSSSRQILAALLDAKSPVRRLILDEQRLELDGLLTQFDDMRSQLNRVVADQMSRAGVPAVEAAFRANLLTILPIVGGLNIDALASDYFRGLQGVLADPNVYPLLDREAAELVRVFVEAGAINAGRFAIDRSTQVGAAERFLARLPTFPLATMDEIVGIRSDLHRPLHAFRSAMAKMSQSLGASALDREFDEAAQNAWVAEVAPALAELDELVRDRKILQTYGYDIATSSAGWTSGLLAGLLTRDVQAGALVGGAAGVAVSTLKAAREREHATRRLHANPFFFLHQTESKLSHR